MIAAPSLCAFSYLERRMLAGYTPGGHSRFVLSDPGAGAPRRVTVVVPDDIGDLGFVCESDLPQAYPVGCWVYVTLSGGFSEAAHRAPGEAVVVVTRPAGSVSEFASLSAA